MKSRKFNSREDAEAYMKERGELVYGGRDGNDAKTYVYSLTVGPKVYVLLVSEDGNVVVTGERYKD